MDFTGLCQADMLCSEHACSDFVIEENFWQVNDNMSEKNKVHKSDIVLESDISIVEAEAQNIFA